MNNALRQLMAYIATWRAALYVGAGLAATPSVTFDGDLNTGMWSPAADTIAWSTGGVERLRLYSNGNIGVNCASPAAQTIMRLQRAEIGRASCRERVCQYV